MRIIKRVVLTKETKDSIVTRVTEHIVENDQYYLAQVGEIGSVEHDLSETQVRCNICTQLFDYDNSGKCRCPACGSRDVSLV